MTYGAWIAILLMFIRKVLGSFDVSIQSVTYSFHHHQRFLAFPQDQSAYPTQHLPQYSKVVPWRDEMQRRPMCNNLIHQSEYPEALAFQEAEVKHSHSGFEQYNPDGRHAPGAPVRELSSWSLSGVFS